MTYRGTIKDGVVVLKDAGALPDGTVVDVHPADEPAHLPDWDEVLKEFIGQADGLPSDMARNHDHYLHGAAKR